MAAFKVGGAPLHPAVVHFPIAAWTTALVADGVFLATGAPNAWAVAYWALATGALTGLLAMTLGWLDHVLLGRSHRAAAPVSRHMMVMSTAWTLLVLDLLLREPGAPGTYAGWLAGLTLIGFAVLAVGGHMGARLVYHHGINVAGANDRNG